MSQATPSKQSRIERHLERQRGAGVRELVTNFGFSFSIPLPTVPDSTEPEAPLAKRQKLAEADSLPAKKRKVAAEQQAVKIPTNALQAVKGANHSTPPAKSSLSQPSRPFETIPEEPENGSESNIPTKPFAAPKKNEKRRGRPKKDASKEAPSTSEQASRPRPSPPLKKQVGTPIAVTKEIKRRGRPKKDAMKDDETTVEEVGVADLRSQEQEQVSRPRRQAAANARIRVADGFMDEEAPIDKKRRDPEPERVIHAKQKKATPAAHTSIAESDKCPQMPTIHPADETAESEVSKSNKLKNMKSRKVQPDTNEPAYEEKMKLPAPAARRKHKPLKDTDQQQLSTPSIETARIPLADTHANIAVRKSASPEKLKQDASTQVRERVLPSIPRESPTKPPATSVKPVRRKRKAEEIFADQQHRADAAFETPASTMLSNQIKPGRSKQTQSLIPVGDAEAAFAVSKPDAANLRAVDAIGAKAKPKAAEGVPRSRRHKQDLAMRGEASQPGENVAAEDVDWLFEKTGRAASLKASKFRTRHRVPTAVQEMDLDDLLSNIAAFAPKNPQSRR